MTELLSDLETPSDAELISRVRGGDVAAYGELFSRHVQAANRLARQLVRGPDADDLVSDAFAKVLGVLQGGGGPDVAFRAYLLTAVRRLHVDKVRAGSRLQTSDDMTQFDPGIPFQDTAVSGFESGAAARAFASLPERWQLVLWHLEVEGQKPADIAPLLGMSANSVSALAYRAREGLRQAFLTMHLSDISADSCRWVNEHLGAYVRHGLAKRDAAKVEDHLQECRRCTAMYLELTEVNSDLKAIIAPLLLGAAATGYLASSGSAGTAGVLTLLGRVRDVITANAGVAATGAAAAGVAAVATTAVLLTQGHPGTVIGADRPIAATTRVAQSGAADAGSPAPSSRPSSAGTSPAVALASTQPGLVPSSGPSGTGTLPGTLPGTGPGTAPGTGPGSTPGTGPGAGSASPAAPSTGPTGQPSGSPTHSPSSPGTPTGSPTHQPTRTPTGGPTSAPTGGPTSTPTGGPTSPGTGGNTGGPTGGPTSPVTTPPSSGGTETPGGGSGGTGGSASPAFAPLAVGPTGPDELGRFPVQMSLTGLPDNLGTLTFTVAPVSNQMGLSQFTAPTVVSFADGAPASLDETVAATGGTCSLDDPTTLTCTGIIGSTLSAIFPVTVTPLETTKVRITAAGTTNTGAQVTVISDALPIDPPTADVGLSGLAVTSRDSDGNYHVSGTVTGIPAGYAHLADRPTYTVTSDNAAVDPDPISATTTCPDPDNASPCLVNLVIAASGVTDEAHATVTVGSLPGYIDDTTPDSNGLPNNAATVTLEPAVPSQGLQMTLSGWTKVQGTNWTAVVQVTGAQSGPLTFMVDDAKAGSSGSGSVSDGSSDKAVTIASITPDGDGDSCPAVAGPTVTCSNADGDFTATFEFKIPVGHEDSATLTVSDGSPTSADARLSPSAGQVG